MLAKVSDDEVDAVILLLLPSCPRRVAGGDRDLRRLETGWGIEVGVGWGVSPVSNLIFNVQSTTLSLIRKEHKLPR